jgi:hypothetical protein
VRFHDNFNLPSRVSQQIESWMRGTLRAEEVVVSRDPTSAVALQVCSLRWLLVGLFPLGVALTARTWGEYFGPAIFVSLMTSFCCGLFLLRIRVVSYRTLMPILVASVLIIAYPLRAYFFALTSWDPVGLGALSYLRNWVLVLSSRMLFDAYEMSMIGLCTFFLSFFVLMRGRGHGRHASEWRVGLSSKRMISLLWHALAITVFFTVSLNLIALRLGILVMGAEPPHLPYRLTGIIATLRIFFGSNLLLLLLFFALKLRANTLARTVVTVMLLHGVLLAVVSASRGALVTWMVNPVLLLVTMREHEHKDTHPLKWKWVILALAVLCVSLVAHPLITAYRGAVVSKRLTTSEALRSATDFTIDAIKNDPLEVLSASVGTISARIVGLEQLVLLKEVVGTPNPTAMWHSLSVRNQNISAYYTHEHLRLEDYGSALTPGLMGTFWLLGGLPMIVIGMVCFSVLMFAMNALYGLYVPLVIAPVTLAAFANSAANIASEGTLFELLRLEPLILTLGTLLVTEVLARLIIGLAQKQGRNTVATPERIGGKLMGPGSNESPDIP